MLSRCQPRYKSIYVEPCQWIRARILLVFLSDAKCARYFGLRETLVVFLSIPWCNIEKMESTEELFFTSITCYLFNNTKQNLLFYGSLAIQI